MSKCMHTQWLPKHEMQIYQQIFITKNKLTFAQFAQLQQAMSSSWLLKFYKRCLVSKMVTNSFRGSSAVPIFLIDSRQQHGPSN